MSAEDQRDPPPELEQHRSPIAGGFGDPPRVPMTIEERRRFLRQAAVVAGATAAAG
jgi:hypothetical protein